MSADRKISATLTRGQLTGSAELKLLAEENNKYCRGHGPRRGHGKAQPFRTAGGVAVRPLAEHVDLLEFNSITGVAIAVAHWRRRSPGRKRGRPENGRPYEGWKMSKVQGPRSGHLSVDQSRNLYS